MAWFSRSKVFISLNKESACAFWSFSHILFKLGAIEKTVDAHEGDLLFQCTDVFRSIHAYDR